MIYMKVFIVPSTITFRVLLPRSDLIFIKPSTITQGIASEIAIVDSDATKLTAEAMDMQYGQGFVKNSRVVGSPGNYSNNKSRKNRSL